MKKDEQKTIKRRRRKTAKKKRIRMKRMNKEQEKDEGTRD